jgi:hypothetical protein
MAFSTEAHNEAKIVRFQVQRTIFRSKKVLFVRVG